jgi:Fe-S-cluster-containing hydrogenase component 2
VLLDSKKCIGCGSCKDACTPGVIFWDDQINKPVICVHCGYCVDFCPYSVIAIEKKRLYKHD